VIRVRVPGDKSISHRALLFATLAGDASSLRGLGDGADVRTTVSLVGRLGADVAVDVSGAGRGLDARVEPATLRAPRSTLECGNSGTTARLGVGLLAGLGLEALMDGDESLRARPMGRVMYPLQAMGARIDYLGSPERLPVELHGRASGSLRPLRHRTRVASAQVKSAILLAGLAGRVHVEVVEPVQSRDHSERLLSAMGAPIRVRPGERGHEVRFDPAGWDGRLRGLDLDIPGDPSSAAFLIAAAVLRKVSIALDGVSDNPTRTAFLDVLSAMGVEVERIPAGDAGGEPIASWVIRPPSRLAPFRVAGPMLPRLIDELPVLAALAARAGGVSEIRDAAELRVKESDRLESLVTNLRALGVSVEDHAAGMSIHGTSAPLAGTVLARGDHRIAMAFGMLGAGPDARISIDDPGCASISFPGFWSELERIRS